MILTIKVSFNKKNKDSDGLWWKNKVKEHDGLWLLVYRNPVNIENPFAIENTIIPVKSKLFLDKKMLIVPHTPHRDQNMSAFYYVRCV